MVFESCHEPLLLLWKLHVHHAGSNSKQLHYGIYTEAKPGNWSPLLNCWPTLSTHNCLNTPVATYSSMSIKHFIASLKWYEASLGVYKCSIKDEGNFINSLLCSNSKPHFHLHPLLTFCLHFINSLLCSKPQLHLHPLLTFCLHLAIENN